MMHFDVVIIGSGPAGQKAAVQAAKAGQKVCIIEQEPEPGGRSINQGTIPSKTLRENAMRLLHLQQNSALFNHLNVAALEMSVLVNHVEKIIQVHDQTIKSQTDRNLISRMPGRATLTSRYEVHVQRVQGNAVDIQARVILLATGSVPSESESIVVDHEHIFDTDSVLAMRYLPQSLAVAGADMHACEFATILQTLGVKVTLIDNESLPLPGMDQEVREHLKTSFESAGGRWVGNVSVLSAHWDGKGNVVMELDDGQTVKTEKLMAAPVRKANVAHLGLAGVGIELTDDGFIKVNDLLQTSVSNIFAAGDVIGPPALASTAMEQGRRAMCNAFRIPTVGGSELIPTAVYAIPEIATVGLTEAEALQHHRSVIVGRANFREIVRGQISGHRDGFLKMVSDAAGRQLLGIQIVGEGSSELIHIGQLASLNQNPIDVFIDNVFNFPTMAEAYRVAALDIFGQRMRLTNAY
ncbi:Si-specific NAD(P)(+) transhydrogenase [Reinekea sp. G2M2-21]|uniref:Si-specific NAD(P)(+) transhydrogenase n=1 Tax=Reinekea sp. G2M2-21 TaxID=2788942 RepID=UPI0018AA41D2|nr:Si-specific NAD(P)(+) transhydrogenase [Reinekea sp. G2M2-21]